MNKITRALLFLSLFSIALPLTGSAQPEGQPVMRYALLTGGQEKLAKARRAVILFTGVDSLRTKTMEDALAVELASMGIDIVSRSRFESLIAEKMAEAYAAERVAQATPSKEATAQKPEPPVAPPKPVGAIQVAKGVGAQIVLIGTMLDERQRSELVAAGKPGRLLDQPLLLVNASIQVVDVESDSVLMLIFGQWPDGTSIGDASSALGLPIKQAVKH